MNQFFTFKPLTIGVLLLATGLLTACGSGSNSISNTTSVGSVTATSAAYNKSTTFTISGVNLPGSVTPTVSNCSGLSAVASTSPTLRQFTCVPDGLSVGVSVNYGGITPYTTTISVPRPNVAMVTSMGTVVVELYPENAPATVKNFLAYVNNGFYTNTIFHRIIASAVNQGGGFIANADGSISQKTNTTAPIVLESNNGLSNLKYTLAMARTPVADSATSQFFFNLANNSASLDYKASAGIPNGYAVFGKAISGTAVLDTMNLVSTTAKSGNLDVPVTAVTLQSATQTQ